MRQKLLNAFTKLMSLAGKFAGFIAAIPIIACMAVSFILGALWRFSLYAFAKGADIATEILKGLNHNVINNQR